LRRFVRRDLLLRLLIHLLHVDLFALLNEARTHLVHVQELFVFVLLAKLACSLQRHLLQLVFAVAAHALHSLEVLNPLRGHRQDEVSAAAILFICIEMLMLVFAGSPSTCRGLLQTSHVVEGFLTSLGPHFRLVEVLTTRIRLVRVGWLQHVHGHGRRHVLLPLLLRKATVVPLAVR